MDTTILFGPRPQIRPVTASKPRLPRIIDAGHRAHRDACTLEVSDRDGLLVERVIAPREPTATAHPA